MPPNTPQQLHAIHDFIIATSQTQTVDEAWEFLLQHLRTYHICSGLYAFVRSKFQGDPDAEIIYFSNHSEEFTQRYEAEGWEKNDVAVKHCQQEAEKVQVWYDPAYTAELSEDELAVERAIHDDFGMTSGITFPLRSDSSNHDWGGIGLASKLSYDNFTQLVLPHAEHLRCVVTIFHFIALKKPMHRDVHQLSPREQAVLQLASTGMTAKEIARTLVLSHQMVNTHLQTARSKLDASTTAHAVAEALRLQLITIGQPHITTASPHLQSQRKSGYDTRTNT